MVEFIASGFNLREATGAVLLNVSRTFDRVWHKGLLIKMLEAGFPISQVKLVRFFLTLRKFRVKMEEVCSTYREMKSGVSQEAALSPFLYNIYTSYIPRAAVWHYTQTTPRYWPNPGTPGYSHEDSKANWRH